MNDNTLIKILRERIQHSLESVGMADVPVIQKPQPEQQGVKTETAVYFQKMFDRRYGIKGVSSTYDEVSGDFEKTETQVIDITFQVSVLIPPTYSEDALTALDVVNAVAMGLASRPSVREYVKNGFNVLKITDVTNPVFTDDRFQFEFMPSFDIVFVASRQYNSRVPKVDKYRGDAYEV